MNLRYNAILLDTWFLGSFTNWLNTIGRRHDQTLPLPVRLDRLVPPLHRC